MRRHRGPGTYARLAAVLLALLAGACMRKESDQARLVTLEGEIVDLQCYFTHGARGLDHRACALFCAKGGQNMAFLNRAGEKVIPIVGRHHGADPNDSTLAYVGYPVVMMGRLYERGGQRVLTVERVKRLDGLPAPPVTAESLTVDPMPHRGDPSNPGDGTR